MVRKVRSRAFGAVLVALVALVSSTVVAPSATALPPAAAEASGPPLTNLAHLDFLLDEATPPADVPGHTTYRLESEPTLVMPWTYADARPGGVFERVGGGPLDPATGWWGQGAYNADDISRAAVVYLRHWQQTGAEDSRDTAYELLRALAYLQTVTGEDAGHVVLWMQPDGTLNPSAEPVELPDPSDSGPSYWLARTIWAFGEGYAAFAAEDPDFAAFLDERLALAVGAVERDVLHRYGQWELSDGLRVPAWLIVDGADASAEAVLGLAARVGAGGADPRTTEALRALAEGIAAMGSTQTAAWPYGAVLPWAQSRSMWHGWGSQMPAALAVASAALQDGALLTPARRDAAVFTPTLLTAGGPDNGWFPSPADRVQIAYGVDSRVQSLLAVAEQSGSAGFADLAAMQAAWFFGANRAGEAMYDPATGVTFDGLQPDGSINRNSGAESAIHGLLTMLALDAHPEVARRALAATEVVELDGLRLVEAEAATSTTGEVISPTPWTGESLWSGGGLALERGETATFDVSRAEVRRTVEPVIWSEPGAAIQSRWKGDRGMLGSIAERGPEPGISPAPGVLLPHALRGTLSARDARVQVSVSRGTLRLDGLLVRPVVSRLVLEGAGRVELVHSASRSAERTEVGARGVTSTVQVYDATGAKVRATQLRGAGAVVLPAGGFAIVLT